MVFDGARLDEGKEFVQDKLVLQTESGEYELVLKASVPKANVRIVGDLNVGIVPTESKATKRFQLVNDGSAAAPFAIEYDRCARAAAAAATRTSRTAASRRLRARAGGVRGYAVA